jgi:hypothetical protein
MKNKLVIWGTNAENEKVLIALELQSESNKVVLHTFPEAIAGEEFVGKMMNEWRNGAEVAFPEGFSTLDRELSVTESLLPDDLKVERGDLIQRAQTEWHFAVLSAKLHAAYQQELAEFKEKVHALSAYDNGTWNSLRTFWDKVQNQSRERNLYREHADNLRDNINMLFEDLKKLKSQVQNEFMVASEGVFKDFIKSLEDIEQRIEAGGTKLNSVFEELKQMQRRYRDARMSNEHRNALWERLDGAFKKAKERKFGPAANEGSLVERHERRLSGLQEALKRMEDSIKRDEDELNFQRKKINATEGQLEAQIRMAKIKMIEERLISKREKVAEMNQTRNDIQRQTGNAKEKETRRAEKEADRKRMDHARETAKREIAAGIRSRNDRADFQPGQKEDTLFEAASTVLGDLLMDALDTAKAVASVVSDKAEEAFEKALDKAEEVVEALTKDEKPAEPTTETAEAVAAVEPETPAAEVVAAAEPEAVAAEVIAAAEPEAPAAIDTAAALVEAAEPEVAPLESVAAETVAAVEETVAEPTTPEVMAETPVSVSENVETESYTADAGDVATAAGVEMSDTKEA